MRTTFAACDADQVFLQFLSVTFEDPLRLFGVTTEYFQAKTGNV